jgi:hypothetical protein
MDRRERRKEMRAIIKELRRIKDSDEYKTYLQDEKFADIVRRGLPLLEATQHPDQNIQMKFGRALNILSEITQLEERFKYLHVGFKEKQNITHVNKK